MRQVVHGRLQPLYQKERDEKQVEEDIGAFDANDPNSISLEHNRKEKKKKQPFGDKGKCCD